MAEGHGGKETVYRVLCCVRGAVKIHRIHLDGLYRGINVFGKERNGPLSGAGKDRDRRKGTSHRGICIRDKPAEALQGEQLHILERACERCKVGTEGKFPHKIQKAAPRQETQPHP